MVVGDDGDSVLRLQHMAVGRVVNKHHLVQLSACHPQVFQVIPLFQSAVMPVESVRDIFLFRVQVIENHICVRCAAGGEDNDLSKLRKLLQEFLAIGTNSDSGLGKGLCTARVPPRSRGKLSLTEYWFEF